MPEHTTQETTFAVTTLGCKVNQADSEAIGEQMSTAGFIQRGFDEAADIYIVNTCTVTHLGDRSSRQLIAQAQRRHPDAFLVVTGCYAELNPQGVAALPGVDMVIGNTGKDSLVETIKQRYESMAGQVASVEPEAPTPPIDEMLARRALPVLPLDTQHIGSDNALDLLPAEPEPAPENPSSLSPFTDNTQTTEQANARIFSRTRVQMKVQTAVIIAVPTASFPTCAATRAAGPSTLSWSMCSARRARATRRSC